MRVKTIYIGEHLMRRQGDEITCNCGLSYIDEDDARKHWNEMLDKDNGYTCNLGDDDVSR